MPHLNMSDIQLYYEVHGHGPPLVLISGVGQGRNYWELADVLPTLAQDFQVVSFDNRGVGQSSMPDQPYSVEMMAADTLALLDALKIERAHIIGHSLGAMIAFELGYSHPERVGGVVMMSGLYPGPTAVLPSPAATQLLLNRQGEPAELARRGIVVATAPGFEAKHPDLVEALVQIALNRTQPPAIFLRQLGASQAYIQTDKLIPPATFLPPLCLLYGEADQATSYPNGELIKAKIPHAHLHLITAAGHMLPIEQPDVWIEIVKAFFRSA